MVARQLGNLDARKDRSSTLLSSATSGSSLTYRTDTSMSRKFFFSMHALVSNYSSNNITHLLYSSSGVWTVVENIIAGPSANNLNSIASNMQGSRLIFANYPGSGIVPLDYNGVTWTAGALVPNSGGGAAAAVTMSADGLHALSGGDFSNRVTPYEFNSSTGLWETQSGIVVGSTDLDSVRMTRDGSRALAVGKFGNTAYPLARNPGTGIWATSGSPIALNNSGERFFAIGISVDGSTAIVGSNNVSAHSDGLIWDGSVWNRVDIPVVINGVTWRPDGLSAIGGQGEGESGIIRTINYDPVTETFSAGQVLTGYGLIGEVAVANDGIGDIALAADFSANSVIPLSYSRNTQLWTPGTPIPSPLFSNPRNLLLFPIW